MLPGYGWQYFGWFYVTRIWIFWLILCYPDMDDNILDDFMLPGYGWQYFGWFYVTRIWMTIFGFVLCSQLYFILIFLLFLHWHYVHIAKKNCYMQWCKAKSKLSDMAIDSTPLPPLPTPLPLFLFMLCYQAIFKYYRVCLEIKQW